MAKLAADVTRSKMTRCALIGVRGSAEVPMPEIKTSFLFTMVLEVEVSNLGDTPYGSRRVGRFGTGTFEGPMLKGTVLPGGACWMLMRRDEVLEI
jgi:hypothetical protein